MHYCELGNSGILVSRIGMGCWAIGGDAWGPVDDRTSLSTIQRAFELGITLFDTADVYGRGHSEELLGTALVGKRDQVVLATKVGLWHGGSSPNAYTDPAMVIESCEASLRRLGTDYIDLYQCHLWWDENTDVFLEAFDQLREQGKIRAYGLSTNDAEHLQHFNERRTCQSLQLDYSILNREPERDLLPYARTHHMGVLVRGSLRMGVLTGKFSTDNRFADGDVRHDWPNQDWYQQQLADAQRLQQVADGRPPAQVALAFVLRHPAVAATIPGAKTPAQVEENAHAAETALSDADVDSISRIAPAPGLGI